MTSRAFVPVEASERSRLQLRANLADCRRIREVWLQRQLDNHNRDSGYSTSVAIGCIGQLRAIAEEEAACAMGLLDMARKAVELALPHAEEFRNCIVESEVVGGDIGTLKPEVRAEVDAHDAAITRMKEAIAAIDAANQE